ncbi:DUF1223 domain-containing protein [Glacieibacterium sp.]|uniref:DUF1223 domain-containing protein n=1 Tax=Glacieibacterium sp. TaxID=2860237 RepID=UPI003B00EB7C
MLRLALLAVAVVATPAVALPAAPAPLTVIELFQSQGCSSCPPANANVNALIADRPDILALSFAVTYWDQLGWKDGFATPANTQRQWDYARGLGHAQVWTPQVVINGRRDITGTQAQPLAKLIAATPRPAGPVATLNGGKLVIGKGDMPRTAADVWLVRYDPRTVEVAIKAGENNGRKLPHRNIVRQLTRLGGWSGLPASFDVAAAPPGLSTAVLVQLPRGGAILAAARG